MSLMSLLTETLWILPYTQGAEDEYGDPTADYNDAVMVRGRLEQSRATEETLDRDTPISDWILYVPAGTAVDAFDRVQDVDGRVFEVVGTPAPQRSPRGPHHIEVRLRNVESDLAAVTGALTGGALTGGA